MTILPYPFPSSALFSILIFIIFLTTAASHCNPCPSHCGKLHNVTFPFSSSYGCGQPYAFQLSCTSDGPAYIYDLPHAAPNYRFQDEVLAITRNDYINGSFVIRSDGMSTCSNVLSVGDLASAQIQLEKFSGAKELSVSPNLIVLIFNCANTTSPDSSIDSFYGFSYNTSACRAFYTACLETLNLPPACFQSSTIDANFRILSDAYQCSSYTSFYDVPSDLPATWPSQSDTGIRLQWVNAYNASACETCMRSNGICGYTDNYYDGYGYRNEFQCLHSPRTFSGVVRAYI